MTDEKHKPYHCVECDKVFFPERGEWVPREEFEGLSLQRSYALRNSPVDSDYHEGVYSDKCVMSYLVELRKEKEFEVGMNENDLAKRLVEAKNVALSNGLMGISCDSVKKTKETISDFLLSNTDLVNSYSLSEIPIELKGGLHNDGSD